MEDGGTRGWMTDGNLNLWWNNPNQDELDLGLIRDNGITGASEVPTT